MEDVSNKSGMLLRVLSPAAAGSTWYGKVGYSFGRGSYGIDAAQYRTAVRTVYGCELNALLQDFEDVDETMVNIIRHYATPGAAQTI